jgi:hypothetical protein
MIKKKKKISAESTPQGPTPYEIGRDGTVEDFYAAVKAAREDIVVKEATYKRSDKRSDFLLTSLKKYRADQQAYLAAKKVPSQMPAEFYRGACEAFQDGRPGNIQHILSVPDEFCSRKYKYGLESDLPERTFFKLLTESANPESVPELALAKVAEDKKQHILNSVLSSVIGCEEADIERCVTTLLKAGADASYKSNAVLAYALYTDIPAKVAELLVEYGANFDEALQTMRDNRVIYGATPEKIEALQRKDARIRELEETIAELTGVKPQAQGAAASPVPAETAAEQDAAAPPAPVKTAARIPGFGGSKITL